MKSVTAKIIFCFVLIFSCLQYFQAQFRVPAKPEKLYPVYDQTGTLSPSEKDRLNQKLIAYNDSTSVQILVAIVPTTNGEDVNFAAWQLGEKWGIRNEKSKNGVVFLIAKEDRTMSIQQGRDTEGLLTATTAGQILDYMVTPNFKQGNFYQGIDEGTTAIMEALSGHFKPLENKREKPNEGGSAFFILLFIFILFIIIMKSSGGNNNGNNGDYTIGRGGRRRYRGGFYPFPGSFGGGGFGGGSSGGGFGGFGGGGSGGFGGGGASGSW